MSEPRDLHETFRRLRAAAPRLNAASDEAGKLVTAIERELSHGLQLGIAAESDPFTTCDPPNGLATLAYRRHGDKFRFVVIHRGNDPEAPGMVAWGEVPWSSCGRQLKLEAIVALPQLLERLCDKAEQMTGAARAAARSAAALLECLTSVGAM